MKIKKILALLLAMLLMLMAVACDSDSKKDDDDDDDGKSYLVCPDCSNKCDVDSDFCGKCGSSLENAQLVEDGKNDSNSPSDDNSNNDYEGVDCYECHDKGYDTCQGHDCLMCNGVGSKPCYGCNGSGIFGGLACYGCSGKGTISCFTCGGTGTIYHKYTQLPDTVTTTPNPERTTAICDNCEKGKVVCSLCNGSGHFGTGEAPSYGGNGDYTYEKLCQICYGLGKTKCYTCGGDGIKGN